MTEYDLILRNGTIYDGSGEPPVTGDVAIVADRIVAVGQLPDDASAKSELDVTGMAVAPGFINMLSWSTESLIEDGRSQSELRQGVTLQIMGEGSSMGPLNEEMRELGPGSYMAQGDIEYEVEWNTLGEYLEYLEKRGVSCNIASFVGSSTLRMYTMGYENRPPTPEELEEMKFLIRLAMQEGAMGMSAALIYTPAVYSTTEELTELTHVVAEYGGMYISHLRSEGSAFLEAIDEFLTIAEETGANAEIYHLKAAGQSNWDKMDEAIEMVNEARASGVPVTADMYTYPFAGTGLDACIPPWAHEGGHNALVARLKDPETRERIKKDMNRHSQEWENMFIENGPDKILLSGFKQEALKSLQGKYLSEVAEMRGTAPDDTLLDLIIEDDSRIFTMYFSMSEENLRKQVALPWVSFCSDAESQSNEGVFLRSNPHPRAYGSFARVLGKYVRDEQVITLEDAIHRLSLFPATNLRIKERGALREGYYADVVVFDPDTIQDHATPENPHQYATGMQHVFVNGVQVIKDGEHTDAKPGRVVRGPGYKTPPMGFAYPEALHPFLSLGADYSGTYAEFEIGRQYIPDLINMATEVNLHAYEQENPLAWAPVHAWRRLGQLKAKEAAEPLTEVFMIGNPFIVVEELPTVFGMIGAPAIPVLKAFLEDRLKFDYARSQAAACLMGVGSNAVPEMYDICEAIVVGQLERYAENSRILNAFLIRMLVNLGVVPLQTIAGAYAAGRVDEDIAGTWEAMQTRLGMSTGEHDHEHHDHDHAHDHDHHHHEHDHAHAAEPTSPASSKSSAAQKKAKRKQSNKIKKLNRKKR